MTIHHCHALWCKAPCPPRMLMCAAHWRMVPKSLQDEVYRTVRLRGKRIDHTWAQWWKAQANAIYHVAMIDNPAWPKHDKWLAHELNFSETLKAMKPQK